MQKEVWVDCTQQDLEDLAIQYGATGILGQSKRGLKTLPENFNIYGIRSQADIESLAQYRDQILYLGAELTDWKIIPLENLIAMFQGSRTRLIVKTDNPQDIETYPTVLETGVGGVLVSTPDAIKVACLRYNPPSQVNLVDAKITRVKRVDLGKRACVDCIMSFDPLEGLLVGAKSDGYFVAIAETKENPYVNTREWRVNAGAAALYTRTRTKDGLITSRVLDDLVSGDEVIAVNSDGITRIETVLRIKKEWRPMIYIEAEHEGRRISTCSQNAETVPLLTPDGPKPVRELKEGGILKARVAELLATHFGRPVKERIVEV